MNSRVEWTSWAKNATFVDSIFYITFYYIGTEIVWRALELRIVVNVVPEVALDLRLRALLRRIGAAATDIIYIFSHILVNQNHMNIYDGKII